MQYIIKNMYSQWRCKIFYVLNGSLYAFIGFAPSIILIIFFCSMNAFWMHNELPSKIILHFITEWKWAKYVF